MKKLSQNAQELAEALEDVLGDVTGARPLKGRKFEVPDLIDVREIRKRLGMSQQRFTDVFGLKAASVRNWEQGRTEPEGPARVLLTIIDRKPKEALEALHVPLK